MLFRSITTFSYVMAVRSMIREYFVCAAKHITNANSNRFLPNAKMRGATHFLLGVALGNGFFHSPNAQHSGQQIFLKRDHDLEPRYLNQVLVALSMLDGSHTGASRQFSMTFSMFCTPCSKLT